MSLKATEKSLAPPFSFPPARCQDLPQVFSSPHQQVPALSASHTWSCARVLHYIYILQAPGSPVLQMDPHKGWEWWGRIISPYVLAELWLLLPQSCIASSQSVYWQFAGYSPMKQDLASHSPLLNFVRILCRSSAGWGPFERQYISWWHQLLLPVCMICKLHQVINDAD